MAHKARFSNRVTGLWSDKTQLLAPEAVSEKTQVKAQQRGSDNNETCQAQEQRRRGGKLFPTAKQKSRP